MLAAHAQPHPGDKIMDIGCGCGIISLILCLGTPDLCITAVEIQEELALIARKNVKINQREQEITVHHKDIRQMISPELLGSQDMIISNPPYKKLSHGRINPHPQKAMARHELTLTLDTLIKIASKYLKPNGIFHAIYPVLRLPELLTILAREKLAPETLKFIHPRKTKNAKLFMVKARKHRKSEISILPPLYLHTVGGQQSKALQRTQKCSLQ